MTWNGVLKIHIFCTLVFITFCAGCFTTISDLKTSAEDYVDLSDPSADKAQLRAAKWDIGIAGVYCYMTAPAYAERVTLNAGRVDVSVVCETADIMGHYKSKASFSFDALAGHDYVITKRDCHACVKLKDLTTNKLVAKYDTLNNPLGRVADLSTGDNTAIIRAGGAFSDKGNCQPSTGGRRGRSDFLEVDAGPITIDGECQARILPDFFGRRRRMSSFEFVAEAGHTYTITATEKECMSLLDITSEEIVIACEPYEKSK